MLYLDSSALVKAILLEAESAMIRALMAGSRGDVVTSAVSAVEVVRAVRRARPDWTPVARAALAQATLIPIGDEILARASLISPTTLRSLDAIQLASALTIRDDLEAFVAYDERLLEATTALGLPVASPGAD